MGFLGFWGWGLIFVYRWSLIAGRLPGRTDNEIKNYWNTHIRRKLLNRGIDPVTHRPINEPAQEVASTTISFSASDVKVEEKPTAAEREPQIQERETPIRERCPDLNLELRISPPYQPHAEKLGAKSLCFACSLGLQNSKDCSCKIGCSIGTSSGNSSNSGYDFLGMKNGILDYRSLEMKWSEIGSGLCLICREMRS